MFTGEQKFLLMQWVWWWEGPGGNTDSNTIDVENDEIANDQSPEYYQDWIDALKETENISQYESTIKKWMQVVHEASWNDSLKDTLFESMKDAYKKIGEPTLTWINDLMQEIQKKQTHIDDTSNIVQISEAIHDKGLQKIFLEITSVEIDWPLNTVSSKMVVWEEMKSVIASIESQWEEKLENLQSISLSDSSSSNGLLNFMNIGKDQIAQIYGKELSQSFETSYAKILQYSENVWYLTIHAWESGIQYDRVDVQRYIMWISEKVDESNIDKTVTELLEISWQDFDQNDAVEDIISETNDLDAELLDGFYDIRDRFGKQFTDSIIEGSNNWSVLGNSIIGMIQSVVKNWWLGKILIEFFLWAEGVAALSEWNIKKQKALLNLVVFSEKGSNPLSAQDFSKISGDDLQWFFLSMDSHWVDYGKKHFWESFITWDVKDGTKYEAAVNIRNEIIKTDSDFFIFTTEDHFSGEHKWFLKQLNDIPKKEILQSGDGTPVQDSNGQPVTLWESQ